MKTMASTAAVCVVSGENVVSVSSPRSRLPHVPKIENGGRARRAGCDSLGSAPFRLRGEPCIFVGNKPCIATRFQAPRGRVAAIRGRAPTAVAARELPSEHGSIALTADRSSVAVEIFS